MRRAPQFDAPTTTAPAWPGDGRIASGREIVRRPTFVSEPPYAGPPSPASMPMKQCVLAAANTVERAEAQLTALDAAAGDGDLGTSMARAAGAIRALPDTVWSSSVTTVLIFVANALRRAMGGTSGPLYATALLRAAQGIPADPDAMDWAAGLTAAVDAIAELGGAKSGDRTMFDALHPAAAAFASGLAASRSATEAWHAAVAAAQAGAAATAQMYPRLGRASYLGERAIGTPDAGAVAVAIWMEALWPLPCEPPS